MVSMSSTKETRRNVMGMRGRYDRGICSVPTCRANVALSSTTGKVMPHGKTADNPDGCSGARQAPYREPKRKPGTAS